MKDKSTIIAALILGICLIISSLIYAYANRYEVNSLMRTDKWTGTRQTIEFIKK